MLSSSNSDVVRMHKVESVKYDNTNLHNTNTSYINSTF